MEPPNIRDAKKKKKEKSSPDNSLGISSSTLGIKYTCAVYLHFIRFHLSKRNIHIFCFGKL